MKRERIDMAGKIFGKVTVIEFSHIGDSPNDKQAHWKCQCECGRIFISEGHSLRRGYTKSCGCQRSVRLHEKMYIDISNQRFGHLVALRDVGRSKYGKTLWECICDCGNMVCVPAGDLRSLKSTSCGDCMNSWEGELNPRWKGGICKNPYSKAWNKKLKATVRDLDVHKCRFPNCEYDDTKEEQKLHVHHINGIKSHCDLKNLVSLCHSHHSYIEANSPRSWEEYFYTITFEREA